MLLCLVAQSCLILCDPHGLHPPRFLCPWGLSRQEYWSGLQCPPPGDLPNQGIEPRSSALQADSLPSEPLGKPKNTGMSSLSLLHGEICLSKFWRLHIQGQGPSSKLQTTDFSIVFSDGGMRNGAILVLF